MGWFSRWREGIIQNIIAAGILAGGVAVWALVKQLPGPIILVIAVALFTLLLSAYRLALSIVDRKRKKNVFDKNAEQIISSSVQFFEQRQPTGWWRDKIRSARKVYAMYLIGGSTENNEICESENFGRLVLLDPSSKAVKAIKEMESSKSIGDLQQTIHRLTKFAQNKGCDVRWCQDVTYSLLTIGNPPTDADITPPNDMWVYVEVYVPGIEAEKRPGFLVERSKNQQLAENMLISFNRLWTHSKQAPSSPTLDKADY